MSLPIGLSSGEATAPPEVVAGTRASTAAFSDYLELTKPRITAFVVMTTLVGYLMGTEGTLELIRLLHVLFGTALVASGSSALNQYLERDLDRRMRRTASRPLPAGRLQPTAALAFGVGISIVGVLYLALATNLLTAVLAVATLASYVFVYTPSKRITHLSTVVGGVPGALPPVGGWAAAAGALGPGAWALFALQFAWQLPHFLAIAWIYRKDYGAAGYPMLSVTDPSGNAVARQTILWSLCLVPLSLAPTLLGMAGHFYWIGALALSGLFVAASIGFYRSRSDAAARRLFLVSIAFLPLILALLVLNRTNLWK